MPRGQCARLAARSLSRLRAAATVRLPVAQQPGSPPNAAAKKPAQKKPEAPKGGKVPQAGKLTSFFTKK